MKLLGLVFILIFSLSCSRHEPTGEEDQFRQIQTQIDRKEYSAAENELQKILQADPQNQRARVILASLYVSQAGITLKDYFGLEKLAHLSLEPAKSIVDLKSFDPSEIPDGSQFKNSLKFLNDVNSVASRLQEISEKFEQITLINEEGADHLRQALQELEKIQNLEDGNALYRGVIKLFYFKYLWAAGKLLQFGDQKFCSQEVTKLSNQLNFVGIYAIGMVQDVSRGFPKSRESFQQQLDQFNRGFKDVQASLKSLKNPGQTVKAITEKYAKDQSIEGFECDF